MVMELHLKKPLGQVEKRFGSSIMLIVPKKYMCSGFGAIFLFYGKASLWHCGIAYERDC